MDTKTNLPEPAFFSSWKEDKEIGTYYHRFNSELFIVFACFLFIPLYLWWFLKPFLNLPPVSLYEDYKYCEVDSKILKFFRFKNAVFSMFIIGYLLIAGFTAIYILSRLLG